MTCKFDKGLPLSMPKALCGGAEGFHVDNDSAKGYNDNQ